MPRSKKASELFLSDAHAHLVSEQDLDERKKQQIPTLFSAGTPDEVRHALLLLQKYQDADAPDRFRLSCGLHPWYADQYSLNEMLPFLSRAPIIGEIGMDNVWCEVPLAKQEAVFRAQLSLACKQRKPVILHTKGQEEKIASILKEYPNRYLVHWYSSNDLPYDYLKMDCYFSLGPDISKNQAVAQLASWIPQDRLLLETDGLDAVRWTGSFPPDFSIQAADSLLLTLQTAAAIRGCTAGKLSQDIKQNWFRFLSDRKIYTSISNPV